MSGPPSVTRVLMVGLDGFEMSVVDRLIAQGRMPEFARLRADSARWQLDHGDARRTGLAWEHVSTGLSPDDARRWAAVDFDSGSYRATQSLTQLAPFVAGLDLRSVVFDAPYFDLRKAPAADGVVDWGVHDPGVVASARPAVLADEIRARFGDYPAREWLYGFVWPDAARSERMADDLIAATRLRGRILEWLLTERLPKWDLGLVVFTECHSASEALWHGIDAGHPLHRLPSAAPARRGLEGVYEATDAALGTLRRAVDADLVVFNLHGMGPNNADVPSMALHARVAVSPAVR